MKVVIQRVKEAKVEVENKVVGKGKNRRIRQVEKLRIFL